MGILKLINNSIGITDSLQWHRCPKKFAYGLQRFTQGEDDIIIQGLYSTPLAFGQALHAGAMEIVKNPDVYVEDVLDLAWSEWGHLLKPVHHDELRGDLQEVSDRTAEASNLQLVCAEEDMSVPIYNGLDYPEDSRMLDEEGVWYNYRFKLDALYRDLNEPGHYVIRDYKTYRRKKWQSEIDEDEQITAYIYAVHKSFPDCKKVTFWLDQTKFDELFTYRTANDLIKFEAWMRSTMRAILNAPEMVVRESPVMNEFCAWCPLLMNCKVIDYANDYAQAVLAVHEAYVDGSVKDFEYFVGEREVAKQSVKVLEAFTKTIDRDLKLRPGVYGKYEYVVNSIAQKKIPVAAAVDILGIDALPFLPGLPQNIADRFPDYADELREAVRGNDGFERIDKRKAKEGKE